jgi:hypothetical protein
MHVEESESDPVPRPPYLTDAWLHAQGVRDIDGLLSRLRPEDAVMRPEVLRTIKATRFSFARSLVERMSREKWRIALSHIDVDTSGAGYLIYTIDIGSRQMLFGVKSFPPQEVEYAGRIADPGFDFLGAIVAGPADRARVIRELDEFATNMWMGRTDNSSYGWTAANRSNRFFDHTVDCLAAGKQPDVEYLASGGGYIIRNAGWHGNGRFGTRSWLSLEPDHPLANPYHMDLLPLYLFRLVGFDVAETVARLRNPAKAVALRLDLKRNLGIGNSSGVGMVAALVRWPAWLSAYNFPRELALAYAFSQRGPVDSTRADRVRDLLGRASRYYHEQPDCPVPEVERPARIADGLKAIAVRAEELFAFNQIDGVKYEFPWAALSDLAARSASGEIREQVNAIIIDAFPEFSDASAKLFPEAMKIRRTTNPEMSVGHLLSVVRNRYAWALAIDYNAPGARAYFWYRSEEHGENRRGEIGIDPGEENQTFVDVAGAVNALARDVSAYSPRISVGHFLMQAPHHAHIVSRVQLAESLPYSEIRGNIIHSGFLPMDGIRFLLSMMGLECSHPHNTRWVKGVFLQGAPTPEEIGQGKAIDWIFPQLRRAARETA